VSFTALIPARLASTPAAEQAAGRHCRLPMVVRVAQRAAQRAPSAWWWPPTTRASSAACAQHGVQALLTRADHPAAATAWPRPASACSAWTATTLVVNVQGDEPLIDPAGARTAPRCWTSDPTA
jgi:3-deoxy-manno-octulosonate cytidylyltransferase (CMP-KDO synthetase)